MDPQKTFTPAEVSVLTGINPMTQLDWRKRGFLPANDGRHSRMLLTEVCRLRLLKEFIDAGVPVGSALHHLSETFIDPLLSMLQTVDRRDRFDTMLAVISRQGDGTYTYEVAFDLSSTAFLRSADGQWAFRTAFIINLADVAADMALVLREIYREE